MFKIKLKWHDSFIYINLFIYIIRAQNIHCYFRGLMELHQSNILSPIPCQSCGHFPPSQWLRWSIIRGPVMENSCVFFSLVCVSLGPPLGREINGEDGRCQRSGRVRQHSWERNLWPASGHQSAGGMERTGTWWRMLLLCICIYKHTPTHESSISHLCI